LNIDTQFFSFLLPEMVLMISAIAVLAASFVTTNNRMLGLFAFLGIASALFLLPTTYNAPGLVFFNMLINDGLAVFFRTISLIIAALVVLLSIGYQDLEGEEKGEYYFFILIITLSMMLASAAQNLMMIYIALEAISLLSYILAGYLKKDMFSSEAGLKYFLFGALSTGVTLYGISLVYGLSGTLDLANIGGILVAGNVSHPAVFVAFLLVLVGFGFKCSLVPFHMWTPDVYQGAPTPVAAFLSVGPKAIGFAFLLRVFVDALQPVFMASWVGLSAGIAVLTMTIGNVIAMRQDNIKRFLAYSTIAQAGYMLLGLTVGTPSGTRAVLFYLFIYALMNLSAFGVVIAVANSLKSERIEDFSGLYQRAPFLGVVLAVSFLSLAGIPPLAGFLAKFFVFAAVVEKGAVGLVIIAALNSVVALYYYLKVIGFTFLRKPSQDTPITHSRILISTLGFMTLLILVLGLWPHPVLDWLLRLR
jgi:NADH-quinone oxidoreductase subunit N